MLNKENNALSNPVASQIVLADEQQHAMRLGMAQQLITREYLANLQNAEVLPLDNAIKKIAPHDHLWLIRLSDIVYDYHEDIIQKMNSIFAGMSTLSNVNIVLILHNRVSEADEALELYIGVSSGDKRYLESAREKIARSLRGQFPGFKQNECENDQAREFLEKAWVEEVDGCAISSVSVDAVQRESEGTGFVQGLEKLADSMRGRPYTLAVVATPVERKIVDESLQTYESLYTEISPYQRMTLSQSETHGTGKTVTVGSQITKTLSKATTVTTGTTRTSTKGKTSSTSKENVNMDGQLLEIGLTLLGSFTPIGGYGGSAVAKSLRHMTGNAPEQVVEGEQTSDAIADQENKAKQEQEAVAKGKIENTADNEQTSKGLTLQYVRENKRITGLLAAIDNQIERLAGCRGQGAFRIASYAMAGDSDTALSCASIFGALMSGTRQDSVCHVNTWHDADQVKELREYLVRGIHPQFGLTSDGPFQRVDPAVFVPCQEAPLHFFLPRKSVPGLAVSRHAEFARSMPVPVKEYEKAHIEIGNVFHLGSVEKNRIFLTHDNICSHMCVAGAPGSGKSNFCYHVLDQLAEQGIKFLVIEPAKGEYASVFGGRPDVNCYGTSPLDSEIFSINPFAFPSAISVTEHMEALLNLFSTCWPMYAAMSSILKDAMVAIYENAGWDMEMGISLDDEPQFPTFADLMDLLPGLIDKSDYSSEVKGNYKGALVTRVKSMTNGTNRMIFCRPETGDDVLFNQNTIIDLSHVGSQETMALIMGILVLRLGEARRSEKRGSNLPLRHVTVLEEAHNLLSSKQITAPGEGASVGGKSVEMITHSIAEMRTYGEGFMIVDQTPSALDDSVNSNTSTKVIFNLNENKDQVAMGKAISMNEEQLEEVAVLERGVCIVRSRGFTAPVQVMIDRFPEKKHKPWVFVKRQTDPRKARGYAIVALLNPQMGMTEKMQEQLKKSPYSFDQTLAQYVASANDQCDSTKVIKVALKNFDWFMLPNADDLENWDKEIRRRLKRFVLVDKMQQDIIIEWLLRLHLQKDEQRATLWKWIATYGRYQG